MNVTWVLQTDIFKENLERLIDVIYKQFHEYILVTYLPFSEKQSLPDVDGPVIFYGSLNLASHVRRYKNWIGMWCDLKKMECTSYYPYYGKFLFNEDYSILPWGELDRRRHDIWKLYGNSTGTRRRDGDVFVRPNSGNKPFSGGLLNREESLSHFLGNHVVFPEELVILSRKQMITQEWRLVVCGKEVVASSQYHKNGILETQEGCPEEVWKFANKIIKKWQPEPCFVLDIGTDGYKLGLIEINSLRFYSYCFIF
jgi:hypothetical protein